MPRPRRRPRDPFAGQQLGTYRGPSRAPEPPALTPYRVTLLRAIAAGEVKRGQGQYLNAWRWHGATSVTVTRWIQPMVACGWAREVGAHLELTDTGKTALESAK